MNATDLTAIIGSAIALAAGVIVPLYLASRRKKQDDANSEAISVTAVAQMFKDERDALQLRLERMTADYEQQIAQLKGEVDGLYRRLYQQRPPP